MNIQNGWFQLTNAYRPTLIASGAATVVGVVGGLIGYLFGLGLAADIFSVIFFGLAYTIFAEYTNNPPEITVRSERRRKLLGDGIMLLALGGGALLILYAPTATELMPNLGNPVTVLMFGAPAFSTGLFAVLAALAVRE